MRSGADNEKLGGTRAGAPGEVVVGPRVGELCARTSERGQLDGIAINVLGDGDLLQQLLVEDDILHGQHAVGLFHRAVDGALHNLLFLLHRGIVEHNVEHKAVLLGLGQRVSTLLFNGVLGSQHEERIGKRVCGAVHTDGALLHGLQQSRLRFRRGTVDLIRQDDVGEDGALDELEVAAVVQNLGTHNVGRHQVGGELNTVVTHINRLGNRGDHQGLSQPRHTDEQGVAAAEHRHQDVFHHIVLAHDDLADLLAQLFIFIYKSLNGFHIVFSIKIHSLIGLGNLPLSNEVAVLILFV